MNRRKRCPTLGKKASDGGQALSSAGRTANNAGRKAALSEEARSPGAIESGGHQVVGFVALRQNKPAPSGRLGGSQGCALHPAPQGLKNTSQRLRSVSWEDKSASPETLGKSCRVRGAVGKIYSTPPQNRSTSNGLSGGVVRRGGVSRGRMFIRRKNWQQ